MPGTYDVQNIAVNSTMTSGTIEVDLKFLRNSLARGCLLILFQAQYTGYFAIERDSGREVRSIYIKRLPQGVYVAHGYDIESNGLPDHPKPAVTHNFTLRKGSAFWNQS